MKIYLHLSDALKAFQRKKKEVFAILSFNGQGYFVIRSNPTANIATIMLAQAKIAIGNELLERDMEEIDNVKKFKLYNFMLAAGVALEFPQESQHAEENLIKAFPQMVKEFKEIFPKQKIHTINIFLTHAPCSSKGERKFSQECYINNNFFPNGCDKKLTVFFKKKFYKSSDSAVFSEPVKVKIRYDYEFNNTISCNEGDFIKEADPVLKNVLNKAL